MKLKLFKTHLLNPNMFIACLIIQTLLVSIGFILGATLVVPLLVAILANAILTQFVISIIETMAGNEDLYFKLKKDKDVA